MGLRGWTDPPAGAPPWRTVRVGFYEIVAPEVLEAIGPEVGAELAGFLWMHNFSKTGDALVEEVEKN